MSFSVGIIGLPNIGKSTLFKALTKKEVDIGPYPFTTIKPNHGIVTVPDERLKKISEIIKPEKTTPTIIEFVDIAGLVKGAHQGKGLGNQFLAHIRECDAILEIVRAFEDQNIEHVEKTINPERDIKIIKQELIMKDLETLEKILTKLEKDARRGDKEIAKKLKILNKIKESLYQEKKIIEQELSEEELLSIKEFQFLTSKPTIHVLNVKNSQPEPSIKNSLMLNLKIERELSELSESEAKELGFESKLDQLILACYDILYLITFYTVAGGKEVRAWTVKKGAKAPEAGRVVHSDFEEKFIRAEVIFWEELAKIGSWLKAREKGLIKTVGREHVVLDGDVIEFKI